MKLLLIKNLSIKWIMVVTLLLITISILYAVEPVYEFPGNADICQELCDPLPVASCYLAENPPGSGYYHLYCRYF